MLSSNVAELQCENDYVTDSVQLDFDSDNESITLSKEEIVELEKTSTEGIRDNQVSWLNGLLLDASKTGNFTAFFQAILSLLKCGKKRKVKSDCQFVIFKSQKGYYSIIGSVKSLRLKHKLQEPLQGDLYICDLGSLGLVFRDDSLERESFIQLVFESTFNRKSTKISKFEIFCFSREDVSYKVLDYKVDSLQYALENEDAKAMKTICNVLNKSKEHDHILKELTVDALIEVIRQQNSTSNELLGCIDCLLDSKVDSLDFDSAEDSSLVRKLKIFAHTICNSDMLLRKVCKALYENIVKAICLVDLESVKKVKSDYFRSNMLGTDQTSTRNMIVDMSYGPDNDNIIFLLMQSDSLRLLKLLFHQYDLDVEKTNSYGYSVLHFAALYNAKRCARFLLKNHPTIRQKPAKSGLTPLHVAAGSDSFEVLKLLVEHNPSAIYVKDNVGRSIIHHTALGGYVNNIRYCIEKLDMDANEQAVVFDSDGQIDTLLNASRNCTPLHFAIEQGKLAVVDYLMSNPKVDFFIENSQGYTAITSVDSKGNTLLHQCVMHDNPDLLFNSILLGWEQVILVRNDFGETAFDIAISEGRVLCSCILLYFYVNVAQDYRDNYGNKVFECKDSYGNTLLHQTVNICSVNLVRKILSYDDVNLMSVNKNQETPLDLAIKLRNIEIISLLLADKRQRLIAKNGSSYVVKLMNYGLMTEEIYKLIKSRKLRKKRKLCYKLTISLVLSFMVVTSVVMACIVKFHKEINSIFAVVRDRLSPQLFFMLISGFILVSIFISCYLFGKLYIELMQRKKLLPIEISKIDSAKSTDSTSSINSEYIDVPSNGKQAPSDSNSRSSSSDTRSSSPQNSCNSLPTSNLELPMPNIELERRHSIDAIGSKGIIKHITSLEECRRLPQFTSLEECRKLPQCSNTLQRSLTLASLR